MGGSVGQFLMVVMGPCKGRRLYRWVVVWTRGCTGGWQCGSVLNGGDGALQGEEVVQVGGSVDQRL